MPPDPSRTGPVEAAQAAPQRSAVPTPDLYRTWLSLRTRNRDTDQFGHVNHAAMATLFEESRIALLFGPELESEMGEVDLLIAKLTMTFHKELRAPGDIAVGARVTRMGTSSLDVSQALFEGSTCFASAEAVCVLMGKHSRRPFPATDTIRRHLLGEPPLAGL